MNNLHNLNGYNTPQNNYPHNSFPEGRDIYFNPIGNSSHEVPNSFHNNFNNFNRNDNPNNISNYSNVSTVNSYTNNIPSPFTSPVMSLNTNHTGVYSYPNVCENFFERGFPMPLPYYYSSVGLNKINLLESKRVEGHISMNLNKKKDKNTKKKVNAKCSKLHQICLEREEFYDLDQLMNSLRSNLSSFVRTQKGSRTLQKILDRIPPEKLFVILEQLRGDFSFLMTDTYGNYLCQKLIQCCSAEQRVYILKHIVKEFSFIACHASGTHSLQSLIEIVNMKEEEDLIKECVKEDIIKLSLDNNGTHVMQKIVTCINEQDRSHINNLILNNFYKLVFDSNGLCVLKKFINGNQSPEIKRTLIDKIQLNALEIVQNPFGNYIIQHVFDEWGMHILKELLNLIIQNVISLSMQKFSSNVVEKCLDISDPVSLINIRTRGPRSTRRSSTPQKFLL